MKKIFTKILIAVMLPGLLSLSACKKLSSYDYPPSIAVPYDIITNDGNFSYFKAAVDRAGLADMFKSNDAYTIFVPTNTAVLNSGYTLAMLSTTMTEADVAVFVKNHIIKGKVDVKAVTGDQATLSGRKVGIQNIAGAYYADGGDITNPDEVTTGGFVNIINKALVTNRNTVIDVMNAYTASTGTANLQFTMLAAAITRASTGSTNFTALLTGSDPYTLLAPNNGAWIDAGYANVAAINAAKPDDLGAILKYHMIKGAKLTTAFDSVPVAAYNGTNIYFDKIRNPAHFTYFLANGILFGNTPPSNLMANNGVLHTVARLLQPPVNSTTLAQIQGNASLSVFYALIQRASTADPKMNFSDMLSSPTASYTIFAVNNAGMAAAGYADVASINAESPAKLANILKLHMISKRVNNISEGDTGSLPTLYTGTNAGGNAYIPSLSFTTTGGYKIKGPGNPAAISVLTGNVTTTNGILNIIGSILLP